MIEQSSNKNNGNSYLQNNPTQNNAWGVQPVTNITATTLTENIKTDFLYNSNNANSNTFTDNANISTDAINLYNQDKTVTSTASAVNPISSVDTKEEDKKNISDNVYVKGMAKIWVQNYKDQAEELDEENFFDKYIKMAEERQKKTES